MKILILGPDINTVGGIQSYYSKLIKEFKLHVEYFTIGRRPNENSILSKWLRLIKDYFLFLRLLRKNKYTIVHLNPSLYPQMFFREGLFFLIAKLRKKKTIIFFHGWKKSFEKTIDTYGPWIFKIFFGNASLYIVLADDFRKKLREWGCLQPIYKEVTVIENEYFQNKNIQKIVEDRLQTDIKQIVFLARIIREKGVYETIDAFRILQKKYPKVKLVIAGDGPELNSVKSYVKEYKIKNVVFPGFVKDRKKNELLQKSHILCLPTYYSEGLPVSIVEAMASGIPVITRPVGGIADFFENEKHGYISDSKDPKKFANFMEKILNNNELQFKISLSNYEYAISNFIASNAARRLEKIYNLA